MLLIKVSYSVSLRPALGRVTEMHLLRIADSKIVERWGEWDALGMMQQLGAFPTPEQSEEASPT